MSINFKRFLMLFFIPVIFLTSRNNLIDINPAFTSKKNKNVSESIDIIVDSNCSLQEALSGINIPLRIKKILVIVNVYYYSFDGKIHKGQIVINKALAKDIKEIFDQIKKRKFPIQKVIPIYKYNWNDNISMEDNNTSAFNYRKIKGTEKLSYHATGRAIDINPRLNPQIKNGKVFPEGFSYNIKTPGTISDTSFIVESFLKKGWFWGGNWKQSKDYQHFEKKRI